jgi:serine/threonine-protein kinase
MTIAVGTRLGPYEVVSLIGQGGMGEVYRARDTKLHRDVAIKVLPSEVAADLDRLARFEREAQVLAALNHPNIAHIHGIEDSTGTPALVIELVEGPTLADRIAKGPIPLDDALPIAKQIAEALEAAHEQGIIHRDLKPANIKVRTDGAVKVLDFGLAKALDPAASVPGSATILPTITTPAMTQMGVILGTAAYMSPEQARGKPVDKRTDIWAFGCVLYELVTGTRVFDGDDISTTLAAVLKSDPTWSALPAATPTAVRRLLRACLDKDPRMRLQSIGDARVEIDHVLSGVREEPLVAAGDVAVPLRRLVPWAVSAAVAGMLVGSGLVAMRSGLWRTAPPTRPLQLEATTGADASIVSVGASLAVSPDGSMLVFAGVPRAGPQQLYLRRLGELRATPIAGTATARNPFFSPDGQWVGFFADGHLKKIAVMGGAAVSLCPASDDRGGAWTDDGSIIFQPQAGNSGLLRVSSAGGTPVPVTKLGTGEVTHRWPQVLPGGKALIYTAHAYITGFDDAAVVVQTLPDGPPRVVHRGGYYGRYLRSGHLVYVHQGTLFAESFDLARLESTGPAVPVSEQLSVYPGGGGSGAGIGGAGSAAVAWTDAGMAVYLARPVSTNDAPIQWMDRRGMVSPLRPTAAMWMNPAISPDGLRLAVDIDTHQIATAMFVYDWARDQLTQMTFDARHTATRAVWTPDGRRIVFRSVGDKAYNLY